MIKVLPKIILMLELFADGREYSFSQILEYTGLTRSNASHLLTGLCEEQIICRRGRGLYVRGEHLLRLGGIDVYAELRRIGRSCCIMARDMLDELTVVGIRQGICRITVAKLQPVQNIIVATESDAKYPADWYGTGNGRILLAYAPQEILAGVVRKFSLPSAYVWKAASSMPKLKKELTQIRQQGFVSMTLGNEVKILAVPVRDCSGKVTFALSTAFPLYRNKRTDEEILEKLQYCGSRLEKELRIAGIEIENLQ